MPSIPLEHFPAEFSARCYKCSSPNIHFNFTKHPWMWSKLEIQYSCRMCGSAGYGEDHVIAKFSGQLELWRRDQRRAARELQELRDASAREEAERAAQAKAEEEAAAAREAQIVAQKNAAYQAMVNEALERKRSQQLERKRRRDQAYRDRKRQARLVSEGKIEPQPEPAPPPVASPPRCALHGCANPRTEASKYCSRTCSNRNSALNARARRQAEASA